jgi:hypothetical protein
LLQDAIDNDIATWQAILKSNDAQIPSLLQLIHLIEDHTQPLITFYQPSTPPTNNNYSNVISQLSQFYSTSEILSNKHQVPLHKAFSHSVKSPLINPSDCNYYNPISSNTDIETLTVKAPKIIHHKKVEKHCKMSNKRDSPKHPEDIGLDNISEFINSTIQTVRNATDHTQLNISKPNDDNNNSTRLRLNLIRHRFARSTDQTTLQLFKSFMTIVKKADPKLTILPVDSTKQQFTILTSQKQIDTLNQQQLCLHSIPGSENSTTL